MYIPVIKSQYYYISIELSGHQGFTYIWTVFRLCYTLQSLNTLRLTSF